MSIYPSELTCKPLDSYSEVLMFLQNPPAWRSLCKEITPHSKEKIRNIDVNKRAGVSRITMLDGAESFCHYDPDEEEPPRYDEQTLPRTLVCHDMANGYHDDSIINGTCNYDAYTFYNWAGIDVFCYFSHHLVTIPPLGWINVGHEHGVKVIGTVITEWAEGQEFWEQILQSEEQYKTFASALVAIAKTLKFDGWLLNIENKIAKPEALLQFVQHLHQLLHQELPEPLLVWYDSVTEEGHLNWQNALNKKNKVFFDACDGFFTNYSWSPQDIVTSAEMAGARLRDLYIGIDVWGRNFHGGGQFNIQQAVELAHTQGCSLAIFAPAWTHEAMTMDRSDANLVALAEGLEPYDHFLLRDRALWDSVWRYLNTRLPNQLPFRTSFCRGQGLTRRLYGEVISPGPWYNLRHMQYQPNCAHGPHGYLLSTIGNILNASRTGILKDSQGRIKYGEDKQANSQAPISEEALSQEESKIIPRADSTGELSQEKRPEEDAQAAHDAEVPPEKEERLTIKRKMRNIFKHIFQQAKSKCTKEEADHLGNREVNRLSGDKDHQEITPEPKKVKLEAIPEQKEPETDVNKTEDSETDICKTDATSSKERHEFDDQHSFHGSMKRIESLQSVSGREKVLRKPEEHVEKEDEEEDEEGHVRSTGHSMVRTSINIQLKDRQDRTRYGLARVPNELQCLEVLFEDSFIGGSCLQVNPADPHSAVHRHIRIFQCDFPCETSLIFCVVTKPVLDYEQQFLNVKLSMKGFGRKEGRAAEVLLIGRDVPQALHSERSTAFIRNLAPVGMAAGEDFRDIQKYLLLNTPSFYVPVENSFGWTVRYYDVNMPSYRVHAINCNTGLNEGPILLGYIGICEKRT